MLTRHAPARPHSVIASSRALLPLEDHDKSPRRGAVSAQPPGVVTTHIDLDAVCVLPPSLCPSAPLLRDLC